MWKNKPMKKKKVDEIPWFVGEGHCSSLPSLGEGGYANVHCNLTTKGQKFAVVFTVPLRDFECGEHTVVTEYLTQCTTIFWVHRSQKEINSNEWQLRASNGSRNSPVTVIQWPVSVHKLISNGFGWNVTDRSHRYFAH